MSLILVNYVEGKVYMKLHTHILVIPTNPYSVLSHPTFQFWFLPKLLRPNDSKFVANVFIIIVHLSLILRIFHEYFFFFKKPQ